MDFGVAADQNPNLYADAEEYGLCDYHKLSIDLKEIWRGKLKHMF